jgi:tetratricopeptide (TPR) repeat protein
MPRRTAPSPKSKKDRKRDKRRDYRLRLRERQDLEATASLVMLAASMKLVNEPATPPGEVAAALERILGQRAHAPELVDQALGGPDSERARAVAEAALEAGPSLFALTLNADVAFAAGDLDLAESHLARARELADEPLLTIRLARVLAARGDVAEAVEHLSRALAEEPHNPAAQQFRGELLARLTSDEAVSEAASRLLAEFRNRQPLYDLRQAMLDFAAEQPPVARAISRSVDEWEVAGHISEELMLLALERAFTSPLPIKYEPSAMLVYAAHEDTPPELARVAAEWSACVTFGLWQVCELSEPGVQLVNYLTGERVYANFPAELRAGLRPWAVLAGCVGHVGGIWQAGPAFCELSPTEARHVAQYLLGRVEEYGQKRTSRSVEGDLIHEWAVSTGTALKDGSWLPDLAEPAPSPAVSAIGSLIQHVLHGIVAVLRHMRETDLLADLGHPAQVMDEQVTDATDNPPPAAVANAMPRDPVLSEAWMRAALDEPMPALEGLTPRDAASRVEYANRVEVFIREKEYTHGRMWSEMRRLP